MGLPHLVSQSLELGDTPACIWHLGMGAGRHSRSHGDSTSPRGDIRHRASTRLCSCNWGTARHGLGRIHPSLQAWCGMQWLQCHCLQTQLWGPGTWGCRIFGVAPSPLTLAVFHAAPAAQLVTAHVVWGTVLVLEASPQVLQRPLSDRGRAGVLCTVEQDQSMTVASPEGSCTVPFPSTPVPTWGLCSVSPPHTRQSPPWQA